MRSTPGRRAAAHPIVHRDASPLHYFLFRFGMDPIGIGLVRLDFEFHDARGLVGMDGFDGFLHFRPVGLLRFHDGDDFFRIRDLAFPPVGALDGEIVRAGNELVTEQSLHDFLRRLHIRMRDVDDNEFHNRLKIK